MGEIADYYSWGGGAPEEEDLIYLNETKENEMQYKVVGTQVFRTGSGTKGPWTIYQVTLENYPSNDRITGFDIVNPGDYVTVEQTQNGQYVNYNYKKIDVATAPVAAASAPGQVSPQPAPQAAPVQQAPAVANQGVGGSDPRMLKLLVVMAEQMGVDKNEIMAILQS